MTSSADVDGTDYGSGILAHWDPLQQILLTGGVTNAEGYASFPLIVPDAIISPEKMS